MKPYRLPAKAWWLSLLSCITFITKGQQNDTLLLRSMYNYYLERSACYANLRTLCTGIGGRLSGSPEAARAVEWARQAMLEAGADTVILQPCMVPRWVRGKKEQCHYALGKGTQQVSCVALGSSVGTGTAGLRAKLVVVNSFDELDNLPPSDIKGKIVFYNVFFDQKHVRTGQAYGETVKYRSRGASYAAKFGAVAVLVRSMTSVADDEPHTGNMAYDTSLSKTKIPALAIGYVSADRLLDDLRKNKNLEVFLQTNCETLPDVLSYNVIGQLNGTEKPNEYIISGGHLDSWDNGQGAHDDGAGVVQSIEVLAAFKALGLKPRHSIRAVAFMNEENGLAGGKAYAKAAKENGEIHVAALESDAGGYTPRGFGVDTTNGLYRRVLGWKGLFTPYYVDRISEGGGGADISELDKAGVPCIGFEPDTQRYFDIHHTAADTFDKINKRELELGAAGIGALLYLIDKYY